MKWTLRLAELTDASALEALIVLSVKGLQAESYSPAQRAAALGPVFGVDRQLILDDTYFVVEAVGGIGGCGGWSRRRAMYSGDRARAGEDAPLDPQHDPARIGARRGLGSGERCCRFVKRPSGRRIIRARNWWRRCPENRFMHRRVMR